MLVGMSWPALLMRLVTVDPEVHELGRQYLVLRYAGILPLLFYFQAKAVFDGIGWTRIGMGVGIGMNLVNVLLNWVFIFGNLGAPALGVGGAALASTISAALAALVIAGFLVYGPTRKRFRLVCRTNFQPGLIRPFLALAWPPAVQTLGIVIALVIFNYLLGQVSTLAVATGNVVLRIASLSFKMSQEVDYQRRINLLKCQLRRPFLVSRTGELEQQLECIRIAFTCMHTGALLKRKSIA